eukprot:scaffold10472_cov126-Cylindrotheca_fusiformis.AAC.4
MERHVMGAQKRRSHSETCFEPITCLQQQHQHHQTAMTTMAASSPLLELSRLNLEDEPTQDQQDDVMEEATAFRTPTMIRRKRKPSTVTPPKPSMNQRRQVLLPPKAQHQEDHRDPPPMLPSDLDSFFSMTANSNPFRSLAANRRNVAPMTPPKQLAPHIVLPMPTLEDLETPKSSRRVLKMRRLTTAQVLEESLRVTEEHVGGIGGLFM